MVRYVVSRGDGQAERGVQRVDDGPIQEEAATDAEHRIHRDSVAAMEMALAEAMATAGYAVINSVKSKKTLDNALFSKVLLEFTKHFPLLGSSL